MVNRLQALQKNDEECDLIIFDIQSVTCMQEDAKSALIMVCISLYCVYKYVYIYIIWTTPSIRTTRLKSPTFMEVVEVIGCKRSVFAALTVTCIPARFVTTDLFDYRHLAAYHPDAPKESPYKNKICKKTIKPLQYCVKCFAFLSTVLPPSN